MTDYPIIFSAPMVRALLREVEAPGTGKRMTRRMAWRYVEDKVKISVDLNPTDSGLSAEAVPLVRKPTLWQKVKPGDRLWGRENWALKGCGKRVSLSPSTWPTGWPTSRVQYQATEDPPDRHMDGRPYWGNGRNSIHMPRWASRITLVVTATKIEPVQAINSEDAYAEGIELAPGGWWTGTKGQAAPDPRSAFGLLWMSLHGPAAWDNNPEIVAIRFAVHKANVDAMEAEA